MTCNQAMSWLGSARVCMWIITHYYSFWMNYYSFRYRIGFFFHLIIKPFLFNVLTDKFDSPAAITQTSSPRADSHDHSSEVTEAEKQIACHSLFEANPFLQSSQYCNSWILYKSGPLGLIMTPCCTVTLPVVCYVCIKTRMTTNKTIDFFTTVHSVS